MSDAAREAHALAEALSAPDERGQPRYDQRVRRHVAMLLTLDVARAIELPDELAALLGEAVREAGLRGDEPVAELVARTRAFLDAQIPSELRAMIVRATREQAARGTVSSEAAGKLLGVARSLAPLAGGARPEGTTAASPLARFLLQPKK